MFGILFYCIYISNIFTFAGINCSRAIYFLFWHYFYHHSPPHNRAKEFYLEVHNKECYYWFYKVLGKISIYLHTKNIFFWNIYFCTIHPADSLKPQLFPCLQIFCTLLSISSWLHVEYLSGLCLSMIRLCSSWWHLYF